METYPHLLQTVLDATDVRALAEFYRRLLGLTYRPGDEAPVATDGHVTADGDDADWLVLTATDGSRTLAFQWVERLERTTWPAHEVPMQLHLDLTVPSRKQLEVQRDRAQSLGATVLLDRTGEVDEPLYVFADPAGHPFCIFVA